VIRRCGYSYMIEQRRSWAHSNILLLPTQYFMYFFLLLNMFLQHVFLPNHFAKLFSFSYTCLTWCSYLLPCCNISASLAWRYFQLPCLSQNFLQWYLELCLGPVLLLDLGGFRLCRNCGFGNYYSFRHIFSRFGFSRYINFAICLDA